MKTILALIGFTDATPEILRVTRELARAMGSTVFLIHVADPDTEAAIERLRGRKGIAMDMRRKHRALQLLVKTLTKAGIKATGLLVKGPPVKKALHEIERTRPDLVIVGSHGRGRLYHLLPGNIGAVVVSRAACAVLVVRAPRRATARQEPPGAHAPSAAQAPSSHQTPSPDDEPA